MTDISEKRIHHGVDSDVIENYSDLPHGLSIYEISGPLFFASARRYSEAIEEIGLHCEVLIIRMRHVSFIDQTGLHNMKDTLRILNHRGITVLLSGVHDDIRAELQKYSYNFV